MFNNVCIQQTDKSVGQNKMTDKRQKIGIASVKKKWNI